MATQEQKPPKLPPKQAKFCEEYVISLKKGESAIRAGYGEKGAHVTATRLLKKAKVLEYIEFLKAKRNKAVDITPESVLAELKRFINADITDCIGLTPQEVKELPIDIRRMISGYKHTTNTFMGRVTEVIELKFYNKEKFIEMVNRHIGLYEKDNKQKGGLIVVKPKRPKRQ